MISHNAVAKVMKDAGLKSIVSNKFKPQATVIDLYSNKVIGYATSDKIYRWLVVNALSNALHYRGYPRGVIMYTDRGSNYFSNVYRNLIKQNSLAA